MSEFITRVVNQGDEPFVTNLVVGDLNVDGSGQLDGSRTEWLTLMNELQKPFDTKLLDMWNAAYPDDPGLTYPVTRPTARYDYVLLTEPPFQGSGCFRRVGLAPGLAAAYSPDHPQKLLSDHLGLVVELGLFNCY